jgi:hypothetical protein
MAKSTKRLQASKTRSVKRKAVRASAKTRKTAKPRPAARARDPLLSPMNGTERRDIGHVELDVARTGAARVKRIVYPPGFHWAKDMKPSIGTDLCMHAHVGFLAKGEIHIEYADGCVVECKAPQIVAIEPGHDGWVVGKEPVVLIEFDFEGETIQRLGMPEGHRH